MTLDEMKLAAEALVTNIQAVVDAAKVATPDLVIHSITMERMSPEDASAVVRINVSGHADGMRIQMYLPEAAPVTV